MTHDDKVKLIKYWKNQFFLKTGRIPNWFIETGTYHGDMVEAQKNNFEVVISIELNTKLYKKSYERFLFDSNVFIYKGNSPEVLDEIILPYEASVIYWLDAHYSNKETANSEPLMEELKVLRESDNLQLILIDDYSIYKGYMKKIKAPRFRDLFECETLGIETNGFGFKLFPEAFKHFDSIHFTHYLSNGDNSEDLKYLVRRFPELVLDGKLIIHRRAKYVSRERKGGGKMCDRGTSPTIAYMNGVVYPCCIGDGFNGAVGVTLSDNWLEELLKIKIPCHKCFLSI
jgi:hypothetical protein